MEASTEIEHSIWPPAHLIREAPVRSVTIGITALVAIGITLASALALALV